MRANGIRVLVAQGFPIKDAYAEVGRPASGGRGLLHAKVLKVGDYLLVGSTNWTASSKANHEAGVLIEFNKEGLAEWETWLAALSLESSDLNPEALDEAEARRLQRSRSKSRERV